MDEERKLKSTPARGKDDSEFKLFRTIEDTIEGTSEFVVRFVRTAVALALKPTTVLASPNQIGATSFSRPYTYLAISVFFLSVILRSTSPQWLWRDFDDFVLEPPPGIADVLNAVTLTSMLMTILPTIATVLIIGGIFRWRTQRRFGRPEGLHIVCYVAGFQFILMTAIGVTTLIWGTYFLSRDPFAEQYVFFTVNSLLYLYIFVGPAYAFFTFAEACKSDLTPTRKRTAVRRLLGLLPALGMSAVLFCVGVSTNLAPLLLSNRAQIETAVEAVGQWQLVEAFGQQLSEDGVFSATLIINILSGDTIVFEREGTGFLVFSDGTPATATSTHQEYEVQFFVSSWDAGDSPVLIMEPPAVRWIQVTADLSEGLSQNEDFEIGNLYLRLPTTRGSIPSNSVASFVQGELLRLPRW